MTESSTTDQQSFTGRTGKHQTRWTVRVADVVSSVVITVGGIGTIVSVSLVFFLLLAVVWPLFSSATIESGGVANIPESNQQPVTMAVDEYRSIAWVLLPDGTVQSFRSDDGSPLSQLGLIPEGREVTAVSFDNTTGGLALGLDDGSVQLADVVFKTEFLDENIVPDSIRELSKGDITTYQDGVIEVTAQMQYRYQRVVVEAKSPVSISESKVVALGHGVGNRGPFLAALTDGGELKYMTFRERRNFATGEVTLRPTIQDLSFESREGELPEHIVVTGRGDNVYAIWKDGWLVRYDTRKPAEATIAETVELLEGRAGDAITAVELAIGRETLMIGDSSGHACAWFRVRNSSATTPDGAWLLPIHELDQGPAAVTSFGPSERSRMLAIGYADGTSRIFHVTTDTLLAEAKVPNGAAIDEVLIAPKDNGVLASSGDEIWSADFDPAYPEASMHSLFMPIWYEGYENPDVVWQSSFAGVQSEMKLGLTPLIFGTVKATLYSMLFGAPLALLAAIYTSEFLSPRLRTKIKSLIEMMASLPSVVLGFLGGLVIAPFIEGFVPAVICSFFVIPLMFLAGAYLWQQIPQRVALRITPWRLWFVMVALFAGGALAWLMGPLVERLFFADDIVLWLDKQQGTGTGAWLLLLLPASSLAVAVIVILFVNPWLAQVSDGWSRKTFVLINLMKFVVAVAVAFGVAVAISGMLTAVGTDPRGTYVGTYVQRNALIVGFVMGFAIIPIIYTISEDALSTVPQHLRSASLGAGATPWQTAVRIVIPTAMSGLFSALMIGLGRAVGETMIVLMAAGNTPLMEWNIFNGFRTLSANIAVELPEAVRDSTHYRTLFLAAFSLLLMTFVVNTVAEVVRLRFRKRAVQL